MYKFPVVMNVLSGVLVTEQQNGMMLPKHKSLITLVFPAFC